MSEYFEEYLADQKTFKSHGTYKTRKSRLKRFRQFLDERDLDPDEVDANDVHDYLREIKPEYQKKTFDGHYTTLHSFYELLSGRLQVLERNPFDHLDWSDYQKREDEDNGDPEYVSREQMELLCEHVPVPKVRNELIIRLMFATGMRACEVVNVETEKIDRRPDEPTEPRTIEVYSPKEGRTKTVQYKPGVIDRLLDRWIDRRESFYHSDSPYLFIGAKSGQLNENSTINGSIVVKAAKEAGIQEVDYVDAAGNNRYTITSHTLRHGHAVEALKSGVPLKAIQDHMGHESIETTEGYLNLVEDDVREEYRKFGATG